MRDTEGETKNRSKDADGIPAAGIDVSPHDVGWVGHQITTGDQSWLDTLGDWLGSIGEVLGDIGFD